MCVICKEPIEPSLRVTLGEKGSASINKASKERKDSIQCVLQCVLDPGQVVHKECCRKYCVPYEITKAHRQAFHQSTTGEQVLGSAVRQFDFRNDCFYCGKQQHQERKEKLLNH